jgi:hypothetical protein
MPAVDYNNSTYYSISEGRICTQHKQPVPGSIERVNKNGKTVHETFHSGLKGMITNITTKDSDFGKFWLVELNGNEILQFQYSSGYANGFLRTLPNVDFTKEVVLIPKLTVEGDKKKGTIFINQDGKALKWFYTKEDPNGLPDLKKIKVKGKETWDSSDQMDFLETMVKEKILPALNVKVIAPAPSNDELEDAPF